MLQKEFFQVQPFNPNPYWNPVIVNLSGAQKFENNTVFIPGRYKVVVQAGGGISVIETYLSLTAGKIEQNITIRQPFIVRAYSGSKGTLGAAGTNPYQGEFKVNPIQGDVPSVNHIFGNCGGCSKAFGGVPEGYGSGNCLGDGIRYAASSSPDNFCYSCGAGSCLHILPVNGVFGQNYLFAFHTTAAPSYLGTWQTGGGSAYGGAASGGASSTGSQGGTAQYGYTVGNTPYGNGGAQSYSGVGILAYGFGNDGTGVGHGYSSSKGAAAWFNGSSWQQSDNWANHGEDGLIQITYLGPIN